MKFSADKTLTLTNNASNEFGVCSDGVNVGLAWVDTAAGALKAVPSTNQGYDFATGSPVTIETNATNSNVMLNESYVRDAITNRWHLFYDRNEGNAGAPPTLRSVHTDDGGATWAASVSVDGGGGHGNNRFFRVGAGAYNGVVIVVYNCESSTAFTTDGLWFSQSLDAGATWSAPAQLYTVGTAGEPNLTIGEDGSAHVSWYDSGANVNAGGDLYYARGTWSAAGWTWPGSATRVTTGQVCGRSRVVASAGVVLLCTNTNWGGNAADVGVVRSADNGATWGSMVTVAVHTTGASLTHPWAHIEGSLVLMIWLNVQTTIYESAISSDGGATWSVGPTPFAATSSSDAPKLCATNDLVLAFGVGVYTVYSMFSPDPALTATAVLDNFNRANEDPLSGGGVWTADAALAASSSAKLVSNAVTRRLAAGSFDRAGSYRNDITAATNYEVFGTLGGNVDGEVDLLVITESAPINGYFLKVNGGTFGGPGTFLQKVAAGVTSLLQASDATGMVLTDKILLRVLPNDIVAYRDTGGTGNWRESGRFRDTAFRAGTMHPALNVAGQAQVPTLDDFGVTTLAAPTNTVAPSASGTIGGTLSVTKGTWATANGATPTKYSYQWQSSPAGTNTWSNITNAKLPFFASSDLTKDYRCVVTGTTSISSVTANSNVLTIGGGDLTPGRYGRTRRIIGVSW